MTEKAMTQPSAFCGAFDQAGEIGKHETLGRA